MNINFENGQCLLWLGALLPLLALLSYCSYRARVAARRSWGDRELVDGFTQAWRPRSFVISTCLWLITVTLLVIALAGPYRSETPDKVAAGTLQLVFVMDVSKSMAAEDYRDSMKSPDKTAVVGPWGSRLDMTKAKIEEIMQKVQGNAIGVVTYTGEGFPQADLTPDYNALRFVLKNWVVVGSAPGGGSDYARGLKEALATFKRDEDPTKQRVIVLFSDGGFTGDQAELSAVISELSAQNIKLIIIGLGGSVAQPIPVYDQNELSGYLSKDGAVVTTSLEESPLLQLAAESGGQYFHLEPGDPRLNIQWAQAMGGSRVEPQALKLHGYLLVAALALLFILSLSGLSRKRDVL